MSDKVEVNLPDFKSKPRINPADLNVSPLHQKPDEPAPCKICGSIGTSFDDAVALGISVTLVGDKKERVCPSCYLLRLDEVKA